jgi:hypothetical protein
MKQVSIANDRSGSGSDYIATSPARLELGAKQTSNSGGWESAFSHKQSLTL